MKITCSARTYLCENFQCLSMKKGTIDNYLQPIGKMLVDKGLAVNFSGEDCIVPSVFEKHCDNPPESAAPFYLATVNSYAQISPIPIAVFWRMIAAVQAEDPWGCNRPKNCDYICLQYDIYRVHVSLVGKVIKVAVEKYANDSPKANNMRKFAETCQKIQKSLLNALEKIVGASREKVRWGFACEGNHPTEDSTSPCISVTNNSEVDPNDYCFMCQHRSQPHLTLRHKSLVLD